MERTPRIRKRRRVPWLLGLIVLTLLIALIMLQAGNWWKSFPIETASDTLLLYLLSSLNFAALIIFGFIFLRSVVKLVRERRSLQLGSKLKTRLLIYFALISLMPIFAMAFFSYLFMNRAIDRWFAQIPDSVTRQAREVERQATVDQTAKLQDTARIIATGFQSRGFDQNDLEKISTAGNLTRIEVVDRDGKIIIATGKAVSGDQSGDLETILNIARWGPADDVLLRDGRGFDAAVAPLSDGKKLIIVPDVRTSETVGQKVDNSLAELDRLKDQQSQVRLIGLLTLGVMTFLLIFASSWTAFYIARGLTVPIRALAEGSDEIAQGNLSHRVEVLAEDELAILVESFNAMAEKLEGSSRTISEGRRYIETVLESLPTGVVSFNNVNRVTTINRAAKNILRIDNADLSGFEIDKLFAGENRLVIERLLARAVRVGHASEQTVLRRENSTGLVEGDGGVTVALVAKALPGGNGCVLVIEDLSELIAAQRASAWQEVARRMAHEIKNPLTPIQLSAERIAKRVASEPVVSSLGALPSSGTASSDVVKEGTDTILREVRSLKAMVDEFSRFARLPNAKLGPGSLNDIVRQVLTMYEVHAEKVKFEAKLADDLPEIMVDEEQLKRVFVNLIENALEAIDLDETDNLIVVSTRFDTARGLVIAEVSDSGPGIDAADFPRLFQPYFSTKGRGTGLGLAIVNRIVADHRGIIKAVNTSRGAKFIIEIPALG